MGEYKVKKRTEHFEFFHWNFAIMGKEKKWILAFVSCFNLIIKLYEYRFYCAVKRERFGLVFYTKYKEQGNKPTKKKQTSDLNKQTQQKQKQSGAREKNTEQNSRELFRFPLKRNQFVISYQICICIF